MYHKLLQSSILSEIDHFFHQFALEYHKALIEKDMEPFDKNQVFLLIRRYTSLVEVMSPIQSSRWNNTYWKLLSLLIDFLKSIVKQRKSTISHFSTEEIQICIKITDSGAESLKTDSSSFRGIMHCIKAFSSFTWLFPPSEDLSSTENALIHSHLQMNSQTTNTTKRIASQWRLRNNSLTFIYYQNDTHFHCLESKQSVRAFLKQLDLLLLCVWQRTSNAIQYVVSLKKLCERAHAIQTADAIPSLNLTIIVVWLGDSLLFS